MKNKPALLLLLVCVLGFCPPALAEVVTIPITEDKGGHIFVKGKLNGRKAVYLLDTACSVSMVIKKELADTLQLKNTGSRAEDTFLRDGHYVTGVVAEIETSSNPLPMPASAGETTLSADLDTFKTDSKYDGVVGLPWFEGYAFLIDLRAKRITFYGGKDAENVPIHGYVTSGRVDDGVIELLSEVGNGVKSLGVERFILDTGENNIRLRSNLLQRLRTEKTRSVLYSSVTSRYSVDYYNVKKLAFGIFSLRDFEEVTSVREENILGTNFIRKFQVYVSADRKTVVFSLAPPAPR